MMEGGRAAAVGECTMFLDERVRQGWSLEGAAEAASIWWPRSVVLKAKHWIEETGRAQI